LADLDGSTPECAYVCALHTGPHLASLRKIEMVAVLCTNETTPQFFEFLIKVFISVEHFMCDRPQIRKNVKSSKDKVVEQ